MRSTNQAILHQEQSIFQARFTWQATPKHKIGVTFDQESFCACTTGISAVAPHPKPATIAGSLCSASSPSTGARRSATGCSSKRAASTASNVGAAWIRRSASWGNIDHLTPGMISVADTLNPVTGGPLTYRAAAAPTTTRGTGTSTTGRPCPTSPGRTRLQGGLQQRLRTSREHDLQLAGDALQLQLHLDGAERDRLPHRAAHGESQCQSRYGTLRIRTS